MNSEKYPELCSPSLITKIHKGKDIQNIDIKSTNSESTMFQCGSTLPLQTQVSPTTTATSGHLYNAMFTCLFAYILSKFGLLKLYIVHL